MAFETKSLEFSTCKPVATLEKGISQRVPVLVFFHCFSLSVWFVVSSCYGLAVSYIVISDYDFITCLNNNFSLT